MKRSLSIATLVAATSLSVSAQISVGGTPFGLRNGLSRTEVPTVHAAPFDAEAAAAEDAQRDQQHKLRLYGRTLAVNADLATNGRWTSLPNGDRLWRLRVVSDGALATELYFEDLYLPDGAQLYLYDDNGEQVLGGFTSYNNRPSGRFSTAQLLGESCILEYYEPAAVTGTGSLRVVSVGHAYRDVDASRADACEVDVNCPEGSGWAAQRDATVRISCSGASGQGWCSGALVNNMTLDCSPYFLTAYHCFVDLNASLADLPDWKFYFRYQRPNCASGTALANKVLTGSELRGRSNDGGGDSGSDFLLLEAEDATIPDSYTPYWAGWDASGTASTGGKCIHHPAGDEKKISTFTGTTANDTWGGVQGTHWRVQWVATPSGHGVTEGGSSGSPLFNNAHRIVGTLTGGASYCASPSSPDYFGKVSYHWQSDPGSSTEKLKHWLDPNSTGVLTLDGSYGPCGTLGVHEEQEAAAPGVFPNPASGTVSIIYPDGVLQADRIDVLDVTGRTVTSLVPLTTGRAEFDVTGWSSGTYVVRLIANGVRHTGTRLSVVRP